MSIVVLTNQKGGVGKSTTAYALAHGLYNRCFPVLIVDLDPQSNLSYTAGAPEFDEFHVTRTLYDVLKRKADISDAIWHTNTNSDIDVLTVGLAATAADLELNSRTAREYMLVNALNEIYDNYSFIIIDSAPTLGLLTLNALTAADTAIIPINADAYSLQGMQQLEGFIKNVQRYTNKNLKVSGLLLTKYNERLNITQALKGNIEGAAEMMNTIVYETKIRESVAIKESQLLRSDIFSSAPKATATADYNAFIDEFLKKEGIR